MTLKKENPVIPPPPASCSTARSNPPVTQEGHPQLVAPFVTAKGNRNHQSLGQARNRSVLDHGRNQVSI